MFDLVKFVAAVFKEKVAELQKKKEELEAERTKALEYASRNGRVEIAGKGGSPVYAHGKMARAEYIDDFAFREHELTLTCDDPTLCPITKVAEAEIRLNGILVAVLSEYHESDALSSVGDEYFEVYYMFEPDTHGVGGLWGGREDFLAHDLWSCSKPKSAGVHRRN